MMTPEGFEKKDICKFLDSLGPRCWYFKPYIAGYGKSGVPDLVGCIDGQFFSVEVKREGKEPTAIQDRRCTEIKTAHGHAFWGTAAKVHGEMAAWLTSREW